MNLPHSSYMGFWLRTVAALVDSLLLLLLLAPMFYSLYGSHYLQNWQLLIEALPKLQQDPLAFAQLLQQLQSPENAPTTPAWLDFILSWVFPAVAVLGFWLGRQSTPGKMLFSGKIVDAATGARPSSGQLLLRYLGYFVALLPFGLGILWVALDPRKQGWHDKLARTLVIRTQTKSDRVNSDAQPK
jgi:uncharacterized RDD family membrane protein YckC